MSEENTENNQTEVNQEEQKLDDSKDDSSRDSAFVDSGSGNDLSSEEFKTNLSNFGDVKVNLKANLGSMKMPISQFLRITRGSILELGRGKEDPVDIIVNEKRIADADIVVNSDYIGVEIQNIYRTKRY